MFWYLVAETLKVLKILSLIEIFKMSINNCKDSDNPKIKHIGTSLIPGSLSFVFINIWIPRKYLLYIQSAYPFDLIHQDPFGNAYAKL